MVINYLCKCGKQIGIYLTNEKLARLLEMDVSMVKEAREEDRKNDDNLELCRIISDVHGNSLANGSKLEAIQCQCGHVIDLYKILNKK